MISFLHDTQNTFFLFLNKITFLMGRQIKKRIPLLIIHKTLSCIYVKGNATSFEILSLQVSLRFFFFFFFFLFAKPANNRQLNLELHNCCCICHLHC